MNNGSDWRIPQSLMFTFPNNKFIKIRLTFSRLKLRNVFILRRSSSVDKFAIYSSSSSDELDLTYDV